MRACVDLKKIASRTFATNGQHPMLSLEDNRDKFTVRQDKRKSPSGCSFTDNRAVPDHPAFSPGMPVQRKIKLHKNNDTCTYTEENYDSFVELLGQYEVTAGGKEMLKIMLKSEKSYDVYFKYLSQFVNLLNDLASGTKGIKNNKRENVPMLLFLRTCSKTMKKEFRGEEYQAMYHDGTVTVTCNVSRSAGPTDEQVKEVIDKLSKNADKPKEVKKIEFNKPSEQANGQKAHAEIILIRKYLQNIIDKTSNSQSTGDLDVVISGIRLPCVECAKVLNKLVLVCGNLIKIDYVLPQYKSELYDGEEVKGLSNYDDQETHPMGYDNALSFLNIASLKGMDGEMANLMTEIHKIMSTAGDEQKEQMANPVASPGLKFQEEPKSIVKSAIKEDTDRKKDIKKESRLQPVTWNRYAKGSFILLVCMIIGWLLNALLNKDQSRQLDH